MPWLRVSHSLSGTSNYNLSLVKAIKPGMNIEPFSMSFGQFEKLKILLINTEECVWVSIKFSCDNFYIWSPFIFL